MAILTHGSLFSGIGGFDLASEWMGWENKFHCEWNPFGQRVLHHYWPNAEQFTDITKSDFTKYANRIDILTGGFPCQPYSLAGKRKGKDDERHLWPEMLRAITEIQPRWVVGENVFGLINWDGGVVFNEVQTDLEAAGYEVFPYVLPACAVNAPHRRDRVWFVAYSVNNRHKANRGKVSEKDGISGISRQTMVTGQFNGASIPEDAPNPNSNGQHYSNGEHEVNTSEGRFNAQHDIEQTTLHTDSAIKQGQHIEQQRQGEFNRPGCGNAVNKWQNFPTQSPICTGDDGLSTELDGITFPKWRNESIKAAGNAIVPQVALQIFKAIEQYESNHRR